MVTQLSLAESFSWNFQGQTHLPSFTHLRTHNPPRDVPLPNMASSDRVSKLASTIQTNTTRIGDRLSAERTASFPVQLPSDNEVASWKDATLEAMDELRSLLLQPMGSSSQETLQTVCIPCMSHHEFDSPFWSK
jgi:hypothetical protein